MFFLPPGPLFKRDVQSCIVCCKTESHLPFVSTKHLDMKVSLLSKQRISEWPPETQEMHKGPFRSPLLHQHHNTTPHDHFNINQLFKSRVSLATDTKVQKCVYRVNQNSLILSELSLDWFKQRHADVWNTFNKNNNIFIFLQNFYIILHFCFFHNHFMKILILH